jgi:UDP-GlcNAc3NAcA epimerase
MKVVSIVGARPQFIKAAPVSDALSGRALEKLVHTGQHYDPEMSQAFFDELGLAPPTYNLGIGSGGHGEQTGRMLTALEEVLHAEPPDWVVVYGDTNSTLAGALAAAKLCIPIAHVEAGLRSFDRRMPEEVNRVLTDHLATVCLAPSPAAVKNLTAEGLRDRTLQVGDVMVDALLRVRDRLPEVPPRVAALGLRTGEYLIATIHRAATTDDPTRLSAAIDLLDSMPLPVLFSVHPRTRRALQDCGLRERIENSHTISVLQPLGYLEMMGLVAHSRAILTDSGGLQKEAYLLGVACVTLRQETEWVETVEAGWNTLVDLDQDRARLALERRPPALRPSLYGDGAAAHRIVEALSGAGVNLDRAGRHAGTGPPRAGSHGHLSAAGPRRTTRRTRYPVP